MFLILLLLAVVVFTISKGGVSPINVRPTVQNLPLLLGGLRGHKQKKRPLFSAATTTAAVAFRVECLEVVHGKNHQRALGQYPFIVTREIRWE